MWRGGGGGKVAPRRLEWPACRWLDWDALVFEATAQLAWVKESMSGLVRSGLAWVGKWELSEGCVRLCLAPSEG